MKNKKTLSILEYELPVLIEADKSGGFFAQCKEWDDCYAQGDTIEEALSEISMVATSLLELYKEEGLKIPLKLKKSSNKSATSFTLTFPLIIAPNAAL